MHCYTAFGLQWASNRPIPQLLGRPTAAPSDLVVWQQERPAIADDIEPYPPPNTGRRLDFNHYQVVRFRDSGVFRLSYNDGCEFHVNAAGTEVWATWQLPMTVEDMATYLLGPIVGFVLRLRGVIALHASAVLIDDVAVALLGPAGAGKSTTAAALALRGWPVLTEDVAALDPVEGTYFVRPGYPHVRLWPSSVAVLYGNAELLGPITPNWDKRDLPLATLGKFHDYPARLAAIYALDPRSDATGGPAIEPLCGAEGLMTLVTNTYKNDLIDTENRAAEFRALAPLIERVPLRRLKPHSDPRQLNALCQLIVDDVRELHRSSALASQLAAAAPHPRTSPRVASFLNNE